MWRGNDSFREFSPLCICFSEKHIGKHIGKHIESNLVESAFQYRQTGSHTLEHIVRDQLIVCYINIPCHLPPPYLHPICALTMRTTNSGFISAIEAPGHNIPRRVMVYVDDVQTLSNN